MAEAGLPGQATVDRCRWRKLVQHHQRCMYALITGDEIEEEELM